MALCSKNSLDRFYINKNAINKVKGPAPVAESKMQHINN